MNRRNFFRNTSIGALGTAVLTPFNSFGAIETARAFKNKKAKNIILLVSDGMSIGTLNMADLYLSRKKGRGSAWLDLYREDKVKRALMDTASASSIVTDSAAASSSWGGGHRVPNGRLNIDANGQEHQPIWQKFKAVGKKAGCVTTVPITHATPAGFCVAQKSRNDQESIAEKYQSLGFDVMMGGGNEYFAAEKRKDGQDLYQGYRQKGYQVVQDRKQMLSATSDKPILGVFTDSGLPYTKDRDSDRELSQSVPTLAEMTQKAIECLKGPTNGFVLQVEAGKVDWAAHANDIAGLLYDQIAFDEAVKCAMDFAEKDGETLVIITTDHGNANPGLIYGTSANANFDSIQSYKHTNAWILNGLGRESSIKTVRERIAYANGFAPDEEEAQLILSYYRNLEAENGWYNPKKLPFKPLSEIQKKHNSVGWISMQHSADYVELAMYGPGSEYLKPFVKNTDLHYLMLKAAEVENQF
ncbi:alkaline phosphatase [Pseudozobellia thermophila]|uniref:Alkaline phosphatase n=1 Tax=Pseudozobellia thermophila TaxID=192903 RepID=A0A1M6MNE0_9FLAO|nr:alkaline phosphatase [Pseudozobellia thermophila]SHJ84998.1 alkaline phosphatase [Pseudozobellia thermophila]